MGDEQKYRQVYNKDEWVCPVCDKTHSKVHYAKPSQIDYKKKPWNDGRVKFEREEKTYGDNCDKDSKYGGKGDVKTTGSEEIKGIPNPIFCPHCGWEDNIITIAAVRPNGK